MRTLGGFRQLGREKTTKRSGFFYQNICSVITASDLRNDIHTATELSKNHYYYALEFKSTK